MIFFFNDTATTEIYTLSLHDALPISAPRVDQSAVQRAQVFVTTTPTGDPGRNADRRRREARVLRARRSEEQRLNSSHLVISYAVFCLKKKKESIARLRRNHERRIAPT